MEPFVRIPVRSKRQAMDWSLVLISQGIESAIENSPEANGWALAVASADEPAARAAIRKYSLENRGWVWRGRMVLPGLVFDWAVLCWVLLITVFFWTSQELPGFEEAGIMDNIAVGKGEWWRLFTALWLHADLAHLASNACIGVVLLGLTMGLYGTGIGIMAALLAGVGGNLLVLVASFGTHRSLGASGMVLGCIGLLAAYGLFLHGRERLKLLGSSSIGGLLLFVLLGLSPDSDVMAHAGGALSGLVLGCLLAPLRGNTNSAKANVLAGAAFLLAVVGPWIFAILR